ncbi:hypothetical protein ACFQH6_20495 [Halobacteriaceae archaeon GCM10025711]
MSTRNRRVTLALKWHHLDNLSPREVRDRFEDEGIGDYALSTIRDYLNEEPKDEVIKAIEKRHADVRLQAAERYERLYQTAREDHDQLAVEDDPIQRVVPQTQKVPPDADGPIHSPGWEQVEPGDEDWPEWATDRDVVIRFTDDRREVMPGESFPVRGVDGSPKYTSEFVGLRRDQPDLQSRQMTRREMASHLREKADVLGVYSTDINMNVNGELDTSVSLDAEAAAAIREATLDDE